jgi:hypothetical protein
VSVFHDIALVGWVTRLGEFSPIGRLLTLEVCVENYKK